MSKPRMSHEDYIRLKKSGMLWELFPDGVDVVDTQVDTENYEVPNYSKRKWSSFYAVDDPNVNNVVASYLSRARQGMDKYGVTTSQNPLELVQWLRHLQEELMDATIYIERTIEELDKRG